MKKEVTLEHKQYTMVELSSMTRAIASKYSDVVISEDSFPFCVGISKRVLHSRVVSLLFCNICYSGHYNASRFIIVVVIEEVKGGNGDCIPLRVPLSGGGGRLRMSDLVNMLTDVSICGTIMGGLLYGEPFNVDGIGKNYAFINKIISDAVDSHNKTTRVRTIKKPDWTRVWAIPVNMASLEEQEREVLNLGYIMDALANYTYYPVTNGRLGRDAVRSKVSDYYARRAVMAMMYGYISDAEKHHLKCKQDFFKKHGTYTQITMNI